MQEQNNATHSLAHTSWKCQYHIVFAPKYRRKAIYGMLVEIPPNQRVSDFMGYLKGNRPLYKGTRTRRNIGTTINKGV